MPFAPLERKAAFMAAVTMKRTVKTKAAEEDIGVSWQHLDCVLLGEREGSAELKEKVAEYVGVPVDEFWKTPEVAQAS